MRKPLIPLALLAAGALGACSVADKMQASPAPEASSRILLGRGEEVLVSRSAMGDYTCAPSQQLSCDLLGAKYRCRCVRWHFATDVDVFGATR